MGMFNAFINGITLGKYELAEAQTEAELETTTLKEVEWEEQITNSYDRVTRLLVWPGGAEREITYIERDFMYGYYDWMNAATEDAGQIYADPAYSEVIEREQDYETETKTVEKTAWVEDVPPGAEPTGEEKEVYEADA